METTLNQRQKQILDLLGASGEVKVAELKRHFDVAEMTIRRDLEKLEQLGFARRTFGGAIPVPRDVALNERTLLRTEEKAAIGRSAAELVQPGESIFIDGGTTTLQVARVLSPSLGVTVVTNAINVAAELLQKQIKTIVVGGELVEATSSLVGPLAAGSIRRMAFDRAFVGATGVSVKHGFSNSNVHEAEVKRLVIARAAETSIVIDHSKFGATELISFAELHEVRRIVTDSLPDEALVQQFADAGLQLLCAERERRSRHLG